MAVNRPRGRVKNVTNNSKGVKKRGSGLGTGPVGSTGVPWEAAVVRLPTEEELPVGEGRRVTSC